MILLTSQITVILLSIAIFLTLILALVMGLLYARTKLTPQGIVKLNMDFQIYVPLLTFFWFFTHIVEAFVIQHYMKNNVPKWLQDLQLN